MADINEFFLFHPMAENSTGSTPFPSIFKTQEKLNMPLRGENGVYKLFAYNPHEILTANETRQVMTSAKIKIPDFCVGIILPCQEALATGLFTITSWVTADHYDYVPITLVNNYDHAQSLGINRPLGVLVILQMYPPRIGEPRVVGNEKFRDVHNLHTPTENSPPSVADL